MHCNQLAITLIELSHEWPMRDGYDSAQCQLATIQKASQAQELASLHARLGILPPPLTNRIHDEDGSAENDQQSAQHDRPRSFKLTIFLWHFAFWPSNVSTNSHLKH